MGGAGAPAIDDRGMAATASATNQPMTCVDAHQPQMPG